VRKSWHFMRRQRYAHRMSGCRVTVTHQFWERVTASWADRRKLAKSPFFSRFLAFPPPCASAKNFWPQIWPLTDLTEKTEYFHPSGCGAAGSARSLGACDRLTRRQPKARKISAFLAFPRFSAAMCFGKKLLTTDLTTYGFDRKNRIFSPIGVWRSW